MDKSPNKEMFGFFVEFVGLGGVMLVIVLIIILKFLEVFGIIKITI